MCSDRVIILNSYHCVWDDGQGKKSDELKSTLLDPQPQIHNAFLFLRRKGGVKEKSREGGRVEGKGRGGKGRVTKRQGREGEKTGRGNGKGEERRRGREGCLNWALD